MPRRSRAWIWLVWAALLPVLVLVAVLDLELFDKLGNVIDGFGPIVVWLFLLSLAWYRGGGRSWSITRSRVETIAVFGFTILAVVLLLLPGQAPPVVGSRWLWTGTALVCLGMAATVAVLSNRPLSIRSAWALGGVGAVGVLAVIAMVASAWVPVPGRDTCGAAQIAVDPPLRVQVSAALQTYQAGGPAGEPGECASALSVEDAGDDLHERLLAPGVPIAAVVTADPSVLRGLDGRWTNLGVQPALRAGWRRIGLDQASVFLRSAQAEAPGSVELSELTDRDVGRVSPLDPVTLAVLTRAGARWSPGFERAAEDVTGRPCPLNVVLPSRSVFACTGGTALSAAWIVDGDGNRVGAPVLGIHLTGASADAPAGPTGRARAAANTFLRWLSRHPGELGLQALTQPISTVLAAVPRQNDLLRRESDLQAVHVAVVLDASLSMGRATDRRRFGSPSPWGPAAEGVRRWTRADPLTGENRLSVVVAQAGADGTGGRVLDPVTGALERGWPRTSPRGGTGLEAALGRARAILDAQARSKRGRMLVLLTDGVNVFTERPVRSSALAGVQVVVVRGGNGCRDVPAAVRGRCRTADLDGDAIAAQLSDLVARVARVPTP